MLFVKHYLFFPPVESALFSIGHLSYGGFYYLKGGGSKASPPLQPPTHLKCSFLELRLGVKAIRATHTQARTIITVLDFLLAQNTPPVALWACRLRFFAPRDSARPEIR